MSCNCKHEKITVQWLLELIGKHDKEHKCLYYRETKDGKTTIVIPNDAWSSKLKTVTHFIGINNQLLKNQVRHIMMCLCLKLSPSSWMTFMFFLFEKENILNSIEGSYWSEMKILLHLSPKFRDWSTISPKRYFH